MWNDARPAQAPGTGSTGSPQAAQKVDIKNVKIDGDPFIGQANAPVTIALWGDYQCPFCKRFEVETLPQIIKNYVDAGKVKVVFMDFTFLGNDSITAALYSRSIWKRSRRSYSRLRGTKTSAPACRSLLTRAEPRKPAPPVAMTFFPFQKLTIQIFDQRGAAFCRSSRLESSRDRPRP